MTESDLKTIFESPFSEDNLKKVMAFVFPEVGFFLKPIELPLDNDTRKKHAKSILQFGGGELSDGEKLVLFNITLTESVRLDRNVKSVRKLISNEIIKGYQIGIGVFHNEDKSKWRFTLVVREFSPALTVVDKKPESYTYVFGKDEKGRTAAKRFFELANKPKKSLKDLEDAFSVEALSNDFFTKYKEIYKEFENDIVNNPSRLSLFKVPDRGKAARDFVKRMMGRVVFLYFLQKRGWMGSKVKWENGNEKFMKHFFETAEVNDLFYHNYLRHLFFHVLAEKRADMDEDCIINNIPFGKVPYLNGGLFEKDANHPEFLTLSHSIFKKFFDILESYNFTIIEDDPEYREVAVDPEMLGHIFENLLEDNKEKGAFYTPKEIVQYMCRESLLEYLTTKLSEKIEVDNATLKSALHQFVMLHHFTPVNDLDQRADEYIIKALKDVKVCDPAIGSGAFPMGILHEMFRLIEFFEDRAILYSIWDINEWDAARFKESIIQNSIYGVDIEKGAVDIARLRFWLSIIIDEKEPKPLPNLDYKIMQGDSLLESFEGIDLKFDRTKYIKPIEKSKDLFGHVAAKDRQISLAEAMAASDFELIQLERDFFDADDITLKEKIRGKITAFEKKFIEDQINEREKISLSTINTLSRKLNIASNYNNLATRKGDEKFLREAEAEYLKAARAKESAIKIKEGNKPYFLWNLYFLDIFDNGGFDIVIGNPPYVQLQKMGVDADVLQQAGYKTFARTGDIYCLFYELGGRLLKEEGNLIYITGSAWLRSNYGKSLRKYFIENTNPIKLIDLSDSDVFQSATVLTSIFQFKKQPNLNILNAVRLTRKTQGHLKELNAYFEKNSTVITKLDDKGWTIENNEKQYVKKSVQDLGKKLSQWNVEINYGLKTGLNEAFIIDDSIRNQLIDSDPNSKDIIKPLLRGRDLRKFSFVKSGLWIIYIPWHFPLHEDQSIVGATEKAEPLFKKQYPAVYKHLLKYKDQLAARNQAEVGIRYEWFALQRFGSNYWRNFDKPKIMYPNMVKDISFTFDDSGFYTNQKCFIMTGEKIKYLLGILNSKLFRFCFEEDFPELQGNSREINKVVFEEIPIKYPDDIEERIVTFLVNDILFLHENEKTKLINHTQNKQIANAIEDVLNMVVYELYFEAHVKEVKLNVIELIQPFIKENKTNDKDILDFYLWYQQPENPVRNRISSIDLKSPDLLSKINSSTR